MSKTNYKFTRSITIYLNSDNIFSLKTIFKNILNNNYYSYNNKFNLKSNSYLTVS